MWTIGALVGEGALRVLVSVAVGARGIVLVKVGKILETRRGVSVGFGLGVCVSVGGKGARVVGASVAVARGKVFVGRGVAVSVGAAVRVGVGVNVSVADAQICSKVMTGGGVAPAMVPIPQTQPSTSPLRMMLLDAPTLEYFQAPPVNRQYDQ